MGARYLGVTWLGIEGVWRARTAPEVRILPGLWLTWLVLFCATSSWVHYRLSIEWLLVFGAVLALAHLWSVLRPVPASAVAIASTERRDE